MAEILAVPALLSHVHLVARSMRKADREEVWASLGLRPAAALRRCLATSEFARTLLFEGEVLGMMGVRRGAMGCLTEWEPWLLTTGAVCKYPMAFWRASKFALKKLSLRYPLLVQCIDQRHEQALRWAKRLGFSIADPHPCGVSQLPFHRVTFQAGG